MDDESRYVGRKTIGIGASFALTVNAIVGPALVALPLLYQQAGWLLPTAALVLFFPCIGTLRTHT